MCDVSSPPPTILCENTRRTAAMPVRECERPCSAEVRDSMSAAAAEEDAPATVTRHRVTWTRVTSSTGGMEAGACKLHAADVDVADAVEECGDHEFDTTDAWCQRQSVEEEMERTRHAATVVGCDVDLPFLQTSHIESLQDSICTSVHEMAKMAKAFTARSKAEVKASHNLLDELVTEISELGEDAVSPVERSAGRSCGAVKCSERWFTHTFGNPK